jgi:stress-induced morphogen
MSSSQQHQPRTGMADQLGVEVVAADFAGMDEQLQAGASPA